MIRIVALALVLSACGSSPREPEEHRAEGAICDAGRPIWTLPTSTDDDGTIGGCVEHADCVDGEDGRCSTRYRSSTAYLDCTYTECLTDDDCAGVCECAGAGEQAHNTCLPAGNCKTDDDCGDDYCSPSVGSCGPGWGLLGHFCHTSRDQCRDDADCNGGDFCAFDEDEERWVCGDATCVG